MFGFRRGGFPMFIPLLVAVALGYALASGGVGAVAGAVLFLPLLILKMMFMLFMFSMFFRVVGGFAGGGPWGRQWHHHGGRGSEAVGESSPRQTAEDEAAQEEERDWEEALRRAKREIDKLFPNPKE